MFLDTITDAETLLSQMRAAPAAYAVFCHNDSPLHPLLCLCACDPDLRPLSIVAVVGGDGSARTLLDRALVLDYEGALTAWSAHPLRYGPMRRMWVLPDHPQAPCRPEGTDCSLSRSAC